MAEIIRDRTWCRFVDDAGVEWDVLDQWRGYQYERYPGDDLAVERIFRRFTPAYGSRRPELLEERRYHFDPDDTRWFVPDVWQLQLELADIRPTCSPPSRLP